MENKKQLQIPQNIKLKREFFDGFSGTELKEALLIFACLVFPQIIYFLIGGSETTLMLGLTISLAVSIGATMKDAVNQSFLSYIQNMILFHKEQKVFHYTYTEVSFGDD